jgi:hypothetical protein
MTRFPIYSILALLAGSVCLATGAYSVVRYATTWLAHDAAGPPFLVTTALAFGSFIGTIVLSNRADGRFEQGKPRGVRGCGCLLACLGMCVVFGLAFVVNVGNCPEQVARCRP